MKRANEFEQMSERPTNTHSRSVITSLKINKQQQQQENMKKNTMIEVERGERKVI